MIRVKTSPVEKTNEKEKNNMKTVYIPSGESRSYEYLVTDNLIVNGHLNVVNGVKARSISGCGVITAGTVYCDVSTVDEIETTTVVCRRLMARRVSAAEVFASESAAVSCFLSSAYVETGKLTVALSEIDELKADEVINLRPKTRGMMLTLLLSALRSFWLSVVTPAAYAADTDYEPVEDEDANDPAEEAAEESDADQAMRENISQTVREIMEEQAAKIQQMNEEVDAEDFELKRVIALFKLLRTQGYTLRVVPGTPEENAPVYDFEKDELIRPAA